MKSAYNLRDISMADPGGNDYDKADFDPIFCGLVVALILFREKEGLGISKLMFPK